MCVVQFGMKSSRYLAEVTRLRLQYDEEKHRLSQLKHMLADLEDDMIPGQNESDKDRWGRDYCWHQHAQNDFPF